jgi:hypothetical protein
VRSLGAALRDKWLIARDKYNMQEHDCLYHRICIVHMMEQAREPFMSPSGRLASPISLAAATNLPHVDIQGCAPTS